MSSTNHNKSRSTWHKATQLKVWFTHIFHFWQFVLVFFSSFELEGGFRATHTRVRHLSASNFPPLLFVNWPRVFYAFIYFISMNCLSLNVTERQRQGRLGGKQALAMALAMVLLRSVTLGDQRTVLDIFPREQRNDTATENSAARPLLWKRLLLRTSALFELVLVTVLDELLRLPLTAWGFIFILS